MNDLLPNMMNDNNGDGDDDIIDNIAAAMLNMNNGYAGGNNSNSDHQPQRYRQLRPIGSPKIAGYTSYLDPTLLGLSSKETMQFEIVEFARLKYEPREYFLTPPISCHGHKWRLKVYPHGEDDCYGQEPDDRSLSVYLSCCDASTPNNIVKAVWTVHLRRVRSHRNYSNIVDDIDIDDDEDDDDDDDDDGLIDEFKYSFDGLDEDVCGNEDFVTRNEVTSKYLDKQGSLIIDIDIQVYGGKNSATWYPDPSRHHHSPPPPGIHYLQSPIGTDISFMVGGGTCSTAKTKVNGQEPQQFDAHKCILYHRAPGVYEFVKDTTIFDLPDVSSDVFKVLLNYIYAGKLPTLPDHAGHNNINIESSFGKELLLVSDRFNLILLKLHTESEIVANILNADNAAEWLPFADAHSCPYLKECSMDIYADNLRQVKSSKGWQSVKESSDLLEELLEYYATNGQRIPTSCLDFDNMSVRSLREELESLDLDLDGTKEMLIQRLKDHQLAISIASSNNNNTTAPEEEEEEEDNDVET